MKIGLKEASKKLCYTKRGQAIPMRQQDTRHLKVSGWEFGKVIKKHITKKENYLQTGSSDLRTLTLNGKYRKNNLIKAFRKLCFIKRIMAIPMRQRVTRQQKVFNLGNGKARKELIVECHDIVDRF